MEDKRLITESLSMNGFEHIDFLIWLAYIILVVSVSIFMCKNKASQKRTVREYFLANHTMPWWAVATTLIAVNISAEQLIGMTGTCFKYGIAVAAYEIFAALTLVMVAKFYAPVYWGKRCFTVPQLLRLRYNTSIGTAFSIIWILTYVFLTLTSVSWLGSIAIEHILGLQGCTVEALGIEVSIRTVIVVILLIVSGISSVWGGQNAIGWADVMNFIFIFVGGLITAYFTLNAVGGEDGGAVAGIHKLYTFFNAGTNANDAHLHLIMRKSMNAEGFDQLPGISMMVGGLWIINMCYWGFNQIIMQKAALSEDVTEARKGLIFAAYLKVLIPIIILVPALCAYYLKQTDHGMLIYGSVVNQSNDTMPWIIANIVPTGIRGLFFATITAAVISTLASVSNSTSALFTLDIYRKFINTKANDKQTLKVARWSAIASLVVSAIAMHPLINRMEDSYNFIQEMSSYLYPALMTLMTLGLFWKKTTTRAAVTVVIATFPLGTILNWLIPSMPFLNRIGYIYIFDLLVLIIMTLTSKSTIPCDSFGVTQRRMIIHHGYTSGSVALVLYIVAIITTIASSNLPADATPDNNIFAYLNDIGTEAFYIGGTIFLSSAISNLSNGYTHTESENALEFNMDGFKTAKSFSVYSLILIIIVALIYILFW